MNLLLGDATNMFKGMVQNTTDSYLQKLKTELEDPNRVDAKAKEFADKVVELTNENNMLDVVYDVLKKELQKMEEVVKKEEEKAAKDAAKKRPASSGMAPAPARVPQQPAVKKNEDSSWSAGISANSLLPSFFMGGKGMPAIPKGAASALSSAASGPGAAGALAGPAAGAASAATDALFAGINKELKCQAEKEMYRNKEKNMKKFKELFLRMDYSHLREAIHALEDKGAAPIQTENSNKEENMVGGFLRNARAKKHLYSTSHRFSRVRRRGGGIPKEASKRSLRRHVYLKSHDRARGGRKRRNKTVSCSRKYGPKNVTFRWRD